MAKSNELLEWGISCLKDSSLSIQIVSGDASFRHYYRLYSKQCEQTWIAVNAPPDKEDNPRFVHVAKCFKANGLNVPEVLHTDYVRGFMLLSDFGDKMFSSVLTDIKGARAWYQLAIAPLVQMQHIQPNEEFPPYDAILLQTEMGLFRDWLIGEHLGIKLTKVEQARLTKVFDFLEQQALAQPQIWVHRDYHSRNLMVLREPETSVGIIDFQDAVIGPATYDLISLLKDCYVNWPNHWTEKLALHFKGLSPVLSPLDNDTFFKYVKTMAVQRHLKAAGIFCRLCHRDGKDGYLKDIPRTLAYVVDACDNVRELSSLKALLTKKIFPAFGQAFIDEVAQHVKRLQST